MRPVLLATLDYPPRRGGVASYLENLVGCFPDGGTVVLAPEEGDTHDYDVAAAFPIFRRRLLGRHIRPRWIPAVLWTDWVMRQERPRHLLVSHLLPMGEVAMLMRRRHGVPFSVIVHGMDAALAMTGSSFKRARARRVLHEAEGVITNSAYTANLLKGLGVPEEKTTVIRPSPHFSLETVVAGGAVSAWKSKHGWSGRYVLLSVCRLVERKGVADVVRALASLPALGRPALAIASDGPERATLEKLIEELGVSEDVRFLGDLSHDDLKIAYAACDVFVMVPKSLGADVEGFGIVYLEASLFGKPCIGSRSGGVPEAVLHEETGLLVPPGDVPALAAVILRLRDDATLAKRLGENGRRRVLHEFGWSRQARSLVARLFPEIKE
jgi:phosphatidylinositol alpha-1,6-mannosyltransferase